MLFFFLFYFFGDRAFRVIFLPSRNNFVGGKKNSIQTDTQFRFPFKQSSFKYFKGQFLSEGGNIKENKKKSIGLRNGSFSLEVGYRRLLAYS